MYLMVIRARIPWLYSKAYLNNNIFHTNAGNRKPEASEVLRVFYYWGSIAVTLKRNRQSILEDALCKSSK